jgi:tetratricopeptide (TPR) repeat protein
VQAPQELAQRREVAPAEHEAPIVLDLRDDLASCFLRASPPLRETDELRAAIVRIGNSLDVAQALEVVDEVDDRRLADLGELRELGDARPVVPDVLSDRPVADEEVAEELEVSARRSEARAGHASAATAFVRAAELSADEDRRTDRLTAAAEAAWAAGQPERARELIARALPLATGQPRVRLLHVRGVIEARTGDLRSAVAVLLEAADASDEPSLTLELLSEATEAAAYAGDYTQAAAIGARAGVIEPASETDRFRVAALGGMAAELAGDHKRAAALGQEAIRRAEQLNDPRALIWAALMATTGGALGDGLRWATRAVTIARERALLRCPACRAMAAGRGARRPGPLQPRVRGGGGGAQAR